MTHNLLLLVPLALAAQIQTGDNSIGGVVLNSQTGEPVKNSLVTLARIPAPQAEGANPREFRMPPSKTAFAGPEGEFSFAGLAEGRYMLTAQKPGFIPEVTQQPTGVIELKFSIGDVRLKLSPLGAIEGEVVDQDGEPVRGVNVIALQARIEDGIRTPRSNRTVVTDDRGKYRMWNFMPGKYYVKAAGRAGGTHTYVGESAVIADAWEGFAPVYAGGGHNLDSANPIVIGPGDQARADIHITRAPAFKIRGALGNYIPHQSVTFELLRGDEQVSSSRTVVNGTTGRFEIADVTPGTYLLRATQEQKARGETMVTVTDRDINQIALALAPAVTVRVIQHSLGGPPQTGPVFRLGDSAGLVYSMCTVCLQSSDRNARGLFGRRKAGNDESAIENVLPGDYRVVLQCMGGYPTAAQFGGVDLLANPKLTISPGVAPAPIEITLKSGGGLLSGKLVVSPLPQTPGILLVPLFTPSPGPVLQPAFPAPGSQEGAPFQFNFLAPGDYVAYAFSQRDDLEFRNPAFLQSLSNGTPVHIEENGQQELTLSSVVK
jgi:hypothetical protein